MCHEILLNSSPLETRVAIIEGGLVQDILIERANRRGLVGNVYLGKIDRVLPGMHGCFINIGLERSAFLHGKDLSADAQEKSLPIQRLVTEGQNLLVQVVKDPVGAKGARLTAKVSLATCYLILLPLSSNVGISRRIKDKNVRHQLKQIAQDALTRLEISGGVIVRTAGKEITINCFENDLIYLKSVWDQIVTKQKTAKSPTLLFKDLNLEYRLVRDFIRHNTKRLLVDSEEAFERLSAFSSKFIPGVKKLIQLYTGNESIFDLYQVDDEIKKALGRMVELSSGAYLVIDETEALTTIDVNTGRFVGAQTLKQTVFQTNLEASVVIARQLRVRNLSGIIVVDFINMEDDEDKKQVLLTLERSICDDPVKTRLCGFTDLGLVELTRKRTRGCLANFLQEPCLNCGGTGKLKTLETVCYEIFRDVMREYRNFSAGVTTVIASPLVIERLIEKDSDTLADLETFIHRPIRLQVDATFTLDRYEVVLA